MEQEPALPVHSGHGVPHLEHGSEHPGVRARPVQGHEDHHDEVPGAVRAHEAVRSQEQHPSEVSVCHYCTHCYLRNKLVIYCRIKDTRFSIVMKVGEFLTRFQ